METLRAHVVVLAVELEVFCKVTALGPSELLSLVVDLLFKEGHLFLPLFRFCRDDYEKCGHQHKQKLQEFHFYN